MSPRSKAASASARYPSLVNIESSVKLRQRSPRHGDLPGGGFDDFYPRTVSRGGLPIPRRAKVSVQSARSQVRDWEREMEGGQSEGDVNRKKAGKTGSTVESLGRAEGKRANGQPLA